MAEDIGRALGWDEQIDDSAADERPNFDPLPPGVYDFKVTSLERGSFPGSAKMAACPIAKLEFEILDADGRPRKVWDNLFLNSNSAWKIAGFFRCLGLAQGGQYRPNWNLVPGATGRCELTLNHYTAKNGEERTNNKVRNYLEPVKKTFEAGKF